MRSSVKVYGDFASFFVCFHRRFVISKSNFKFRCGRADILDIAFLAMNQIDHIGWITWEFLWNKIPVCALEKVWELTKKFLQRSHLVLSQVKHPAVRTDWDEPFLHLEGAKMSLRLSGWPGISSRIGLAWIF